MFSRSTSAMWTGISARHPMQSLASTRNRALKEAKDMALTDRKIELRPDIELQRVIPLKQAAEVGGVSADTIRRNYPNLIIKLSPRRVGVRLCDALRIGQPAAE